MDVLISRPDPLFSFHNKLGGAFAEWDYLRGVREGWITTLPSSPHQPSQDLYGTCYDIIFRTKDSMEVIHEFPDPDTIPANVWRGPPMDDDVVITHGDSLVKGNNGHYIEVDRQGHWVLRGIFVILVLFGVWRFKKFFGACCPGSKRRQYSQIAQTELSV